MLSILCFCLNFLLHPAPPRFVCFRFSCALNSYTKVCYMFSCNCCIFRVAIHGLFGYVFYILFFCLCFFLHSGPPSCVCFRSSCAPSSTNRICRTCPAGRPIPTMSFSRNLSRKSFLLPMELLRMLQLPKAWDRDRAPAPRSRACHQILSKDATVGNVARTSARSSLARRACIS